MNVFIVHAHAEPQSFNGALTRRATQALVAAGHEVRVSDLYAVKFDPVSDRRNFKTVHDGDYLKQQLEEKHATKQDGFSDDIRTELDKLDWCDVLIFQFPLWWFGLPAILKGWVDRVFAMGRTYGGGKWYNRGVFRGRRAMLSTTTGGGASMFSETGVNGHMDDILYPINHGILYFVGFDVLPPFIAWSPARATDEERTAYLDEYERRVLTLAETRPIPYPTLDQFDERFQLKS